LRLAATRHRVLPYGAIECQTKTASSDRLPPELPTALKTADMFVAGLGLIARASTSPALRRRQALAQSWLHGTERRITAPASQLRISAS
jgi:hypothetical protein